MSNTIRIVADTELAAVTGGNAYKELLRSEGVFHGLVRKWYKDGGGPANHWNGMFNINNEANRLGQSMGSDHVVGEVKSFLETR